MITIPRPDHLPSEIGNATNILAGPWRATKIGASVFAGEIQIAHVNWTGAERLDMANLMAAAPELRDALKALRDWCDENINGVPLVYGQIMEQADAALKKVQG